MPLFDIKEEPLIIEGITFNRFNLSDKEIFDEVTNTLTYKDIVWENSFAFLYCYDKSLVNSILIWKKIKGFIVVFEYIKKTKRIKLYNQPISKNNCGDLKQAMIYIIKIMSKINVDKISYSDFTMSMDYIFKNNAFDKNKNTSKMENYGDFIFKSDDLINLQGSVYRSRRSMINRFKRDNPTVKIRFAIPSDFDRIRELKNLWIKDFIERTKSKLEDVWDKHLLEQMLKYYDSVDMLIMVVEINNIVQAYSIYAKLCDNCMMAISRCSNTDYAGLSEYLWYESVRLSRDLGEYENDGNGGKKNSGLYFYKQSHSPIFIVDKTVYTFNKKGSKIKIEEVIDCGSI